MNCGFQRFLSAFTCSNYYIPNPFLANSSSCVRQAIAEVEKEALERLKIMPGVLHLCQ
jgi:hypothetical protein